MTEKLRTLALALFESWGRALGFRSAPPFLYDVIVIGHHLNNDVVMAETLACEGLACMVVRMAEVGLPDISKLPAKLKYFSVDHILVCGDSLEFWRICQRAKCVVTYSGIVSSYLRYLWFLLPALSFPPIINVPHGSDITELATERSLQGFLYRQVLRRSAFTVVPAYPFAVRAIQKIRPTRYMFFKYPYLLSKRISHQVSPAREIIYLHASNLDWGETDNKPGRNSTKGNDRFLSAFAAAAKSGAPIFCLILDRGPDRFAARKLVRELGAEKFFEWIAPVESSELPKLLAKADVVVDQFDVGGLGGIAMEAMAQGRVVMTYLDGACVPLVYDEMPPILNCRTQEEMELIIFAHQDIEALRKLGDDAEQWVRRNHGVGHDISEFLLRLCIAANIPWPRTARPVA